VGSSSAALAAEIAAEANREGRARPYTYGERFFGQQQSTQEPRVQSRWAAYLLRRPALALTPLVEVEPLEESASGLVPLRRDTLSAFRTKWYTLARAKFPRGKYTTAQILEIDIWLRREMALDKTIHPSTIASQASRIAAIAVVPNRDDIAALNTWRDPEVQSARKDARLAVRYGWWERLRGLERPPAEP